MRQLLRARRGIVSDMMDARQTTGNSDDLISMEAAALRLGRCSRTVARYVQRGRLAGVRILGRIRVRERDVDALLAGETVSGSREETAG